MKLFDLLYVLDKNTMIQINNARPGARKPHGAKRKAGKITVAELAWMGNNDVLSVTAGKDGCLYIVLWDRETTKTKLACSDAIRTRDKYWVGVEYKV